MISRSLAAVIQPLFRQFPVVALLGPRQVGKTTLARELLKGVPGAVYLDLELPSDLAKLANFRR